MVPNLKPYPSYKSSDVEWLGDVPAHWEVRRIKTLFQEMDERSGDGPGELLSLTRSHGLIPQAEASNRIASIEDLSNYKVCRPGNLVMNRMQAWSGMFAVSSQKGLISPDYSVFKLVSKSEVKYFEHLFKISLFVGQFAQRSRGIGSGFNRLYTDDFGSISAIVPPLSEQTTIVRYLDRADGCIRRYVSSRERLIELLEEYRQAVIHHAVTRGLDPDVRVKPSGVEWLSDVPAHWEVRRLRSLAKITTGGQDTINQRDDGKYPFFVRSQTVERIDTWSFDGEAVLTAGDGVGVGKVFHYVKGKFDYHQRVYKFSDFNAILGKFFFHYFRALLRFEVLQGTAKSTVDSLRLPMLQNFPVALPPYPEQAAIVTYLDKATADIDAAIDRARREIELLGEYRTRLIADVVTGKLDVREVARLPDEVE